MKLSYTVTQRMLLMAIVKTRTFLLESLQKTLWRVWRHDWQERELLEEKAIAIVVMLLQEIKGTTVLQKRGHVDISDTNY